jgi:ATP-binding cassette, subfamily B, bacterial CvaB/MchF/RaxB
MLTGPFNRRNRAILQSEAAECGLACLAMVANAHGHDLSLATLRQRFSVSLKGSTLPNLITVASALGLSSRALRLEPEELDRIRLPAVLHWDLNHFVVLRKIGSRTALIDDPARGRRKISRGTLDQHFTGVALELTPAAAFDPIVETRRLRLTDLWTRITGFQRAALQVLALSIFLQMTVLTLPFYLQLVIDEAVTRFDKDFLVILALSFGFVYLANAAVQWLRSWVLLHMGQELSFQILGNFIRHLLRLKTEYFEKRHVGDLLSRLSSVRPIERLLTTGVISIFIDGIMSILTLVLMGFYSLAMAGVVVGTTALLAIAQFAFFPLMRQFQNEEIAARAVEQSFVMETIRGIRALKLFNAEVVREGMWRNRATEVVNTSIKVGLLGNVFRLFESVILGLQVVVIIYLGAVNIIGGVLTVGMLFAFVSYRQSFSDSVTRLLGQFMEIRMLRLHLERLADIAHSEQEPSIEMLWESPTPIRGHISLHNVTFRYGPADLAVVDNVSVDIEPGSFVAVVGPSGSGKSTLIKLMLGLLTPESGEIRIDGRPLPTLGSAVWRKFGGAVMQDDYLFTGTIADNISFFDPKVDMGHVIDCARRALIHDEIMEMPMNYQSFIGDMGAALSGGQRQRILLARALYRNPSILFLDEGTANLDEAAEKELANMIDNMDITRVVVAHRPELTRRAHIVYALTHGHLHLLRSRPLAVAPELTLTKS